PSFAPHVLGSNSTSEGAAWDGAVPVAGEYQAGLKFLACLDHGPLCEVWKVQTHDGSHQAAKFIHGIARSNPQIEREAVTRLSRLKHAGLVDFEVAYHRPGRLILVSDIGGQTLLDRLQECRSQGLPALPRWELLSYLQAAAAAVDDLRAKQQLQHL